MERPAGKDEVGAAEDFRSVPVSEPDAGEVDDRRIRRIRVAPSRSEKPAYHLLDAPSQALYFGRVVREPFAPAAHAANLTRLAMIITCPSCTTRFQIGDNALGPAGRRVRCAKCGESWWQEPVAAEPEPQPEQVPVEAEPDAPSIPRNPTVDEPPVEPDHRVDWPEIRSDPPFWELSDRGIKAGWGLLLALLVLLLAGGWLWHDKVTAAWPKSARLFALFGIEADRPSPAFDLRETRATWEEGGSVLVVQGRIVNASPLDKPFPEVRLILRDAEGRDTGATPMRPEGGPPGPEQLAAGEDLVLKGEMVGVPESAVEAAVFVARVPDPAQPGELTPH